jgi:hypothetical protein
MQDVFGLISPELALFENVVAKISYKIFFSSPKFCGMNSEVIVIFHVW